VSGCGCDRSSARGFALSFERSESSEVRPSAMTRTPSDETAEWIATPISAAVRRSVALVEQVASSLAVSVITEAERGRRGSSPRDGGRRGEREWEACAAAPADEAGHLSPLRIFGGRETPAMAD
jgi:hypothetical protein